MINNFWGFSGNTENYKTSIIIRGPNIKSQEDIFFAFIRVSASKSLKMIDFPYHCKRRGWILKNPEYFFSTSTFFPLPSFFDKTEGGKKRLEFKIVDKWIPCYSLVSKHLTQIGGSIQSAHSSPKYICYGRKALSKYFWALIAKQTL